MKSAFLPAIVPFVVDERAWERPVHWLDPLVPEVYHPYVLISYFHWTGFPFRWNNADQVVFGDSGGYSLVTRQARIDPEQVIKWQIKTCTRGVMLDIPPYRTSGIQFGGTAAQHWEESLRRTIANVNRGAGYYFDALDAGKPFRWWGVIQGETRAQMDQWYNAVASEYSFQEEGEGWALAPKPSTDLLSITRYMKFAADNGMKRVHLLQVTAPGAVGVLLALAQLGGFELVTYDSASATRNAVNMGGILLRGDGLDFGYTKQKGFEGEVTEMMKTCSCQSCRWYQDTINVEYKLRRAEFPHRLALHNHLMMVECFTRLHAAAVRDPHELLRRCAGRKYGTILREWSGHETAKPQHITGSLFDHL